MDNGVALKVTPPSEVINMKFIKMIGSGVTIITLLYIAYYICSMDINLGLVYNWTSFGIITFLGNILLACCVWGFGNAWSNILKILVGQDIDKTAAIRVYVKSNVGKYLPGNVMHYIERNLFAAGAGLGQVEVGFSSILEIGVQICTAGLIACFLLFNDIKKIVVEIIDFKWIILVAVALTLLIVVLFCLLRKEKYRMVFQKLLSNKMVILCLKNMVIYGFLFTLMGFVLVCILKFSLGCNISMEQTGTVIACYILAWVIGFIVPGAPGGLGVREFVLMTTLGRFIPKEYILFAIVYHRILTVAGDVIAYTVWGIDFSLIKKYKNTIQTFKNRR